MLKITTKQHIRLGTIETPTAWLVVAVLLETRGAETVAVSEPKVVKVIPKTQYALNGSTSISSSLKLSAPEVLESAKYHKIISPYISLFGFSNESNIIGLAAQPPTL